MPIVRDVFKNRTVAKGDLGVEIEVEGRGLPHIGEYWNAEHDGSLRGESMEYVLKRPMSLSDTKKALAYLGHAFKENGSHIEDTGRAGVHIHVNCQSLNLTQLYNFMTLYLCMEDLLVKWCGPDREGNLFCLRARDAEYLLFELNMALETNEYWRRFGSDKLRYASMNVNALSRYGSLEFRAMRSTDDMEAVGKWAELLLNLRTYAQKVEKPSDLIYQISAGGEEAFLRQYLGGFAGEVMKGRWKDFLKDGMRRAQEIAFVGDWEALAKAPKRKVGGVEVDEGWEDDFPPMDL